MNTLLRAGVVSVLLTMGATPAIEGLTLRGRIRDTSCLVLPGVEVTLHGGSTERHVITNPSGEFLFEDLPDTPYSLEARLQGFQMLTRQNLSPASWHTELVLMLPVGSIVERIEATRLRANGASVSASQPLPLQVLDETCRPVPGAAISLKTRSASWSAVTNAEGTWTLPVLADEPYSIIVTADGFSSSQLSASTFPRYAVALTIPLFRGPAGEVTIFEPASRVVRVSTDGHMVIQSTPHSRIRIVAMGDSTTAGTPAFKSPREMPPNGAGDSTSQYAYWVMRTHLDWDVINQGVNGQRSDEIAARFDGDVVARQPEAVVIIAGVNDVYQGLPAKHVEDQLADMYRRAHAAGIRVVAGTIIPYNTATPDQNARMHEINAWIRAQAEAGAVTFADTRAAVAAPGDPDRLASSPDGLHPDAAGYHRMAEAIAPAIERALKAR
jgi:lysophospholipase L1-like esterase